MDIVAILMQLVPVLTAFGLDLVLVAIAFGLTMLCRLMLPGPLDPLSAKRTWEAMPAIERWMPLMPFLVGIALSLALDLHAARPVKVVIRDGLSTGIWALGAERLIFKTVMAKGR